MSTVWGLFGCSLILSGPAPQLFVYIRLTHRCHLHQRLSTDFYAVDSGCIGELNS